MGIHRRRGATPYASATPMRPEGSGAAAPSVSMPDQPAAPARSPGNVYSCSCILRVTYREIASPPVRLGGLITYSTTSPPSLT